MTAFAVTTSSVSPERARHGDREALEELTNDGRIAPAPEPTGFLLMGIGLIAFRARR